MAYKASKYPRLWDRTGSMVAVLKDAYDVIVTDELITGDSQGQEVLDFKLPYGSKNRALIKNEMVIEVGGSRFEVRTPWDGWDSSSPAAITTIHCEAYWYDLAERDPLILETAVTDPVTAMDTILAGTGWTTGTVEPTTGSLQVLQLSSPLALLRLLPQSFGGELQFDNVARKVHLLNHRGSSTAVALYAHGRNLVGNARTEDTTNLVTRLYPYGSASGTINGQSTNGVPIDISSVNGGLPYLEDYSFYDDNGWAHTIRAAMISADNIMDPDTLKTWGQSQLAQMAKPAYSYTIQQSNTGENDAEPNLGDVVRVHDGDLDIDVLARVQLRQRNILQPELTTYNIDTALYTLSQTLAVSTTGGTTVIDQGGDVTDDTTPAAPINVIVVQSGVAGTAGTVQASETVSWTQVTQNDDGSAITDLAGYEVRYAVNGGAWHYQKVPFADTSAWLGLFEPNMSVAVQVRAYDIHDNSSLWASAPGTVTTDDDEPPNPPSAPQIDTTTFPGILRVFWDGKDNAGAAMPGDFAYVEVHASTSATAIADDTNLVDTLLTTGYSDLSTPYGQNTYVWFVALDATHNASDPSTKAVGATRQLVDTDAITGFVTNRLLGPNVVDTANIKNLAVGTAQMQDLSVVTAKIGSLDLNDAHVGTMTIGKITAGILSADITVSARIKTADSGARAEMNATGFHVFNSGGVEVATMAVIAGVPSLTIVGGAITSSTWLSAPVDGSGTNQRLKLDSSHNVNFLDFNGNLQTYIKGSVTASGHPQLQMFTTGPGNPSITIAGDMGVTITGTTVMGQQYGTTINGGGLNVSASASFGGNVTLNGNWLNAVAQINNGNDTISVGASLSLGGGSNNNVFEYSSIPSYGTNNGTAIFGNTGSPYTIGKAASASVYKKNVKPLADPRQIFKLEAVQFKWNNKMLDDNPPPYTHWGFIAEDVWQAGFDHIVHVHEGAVDGVDYVHAWVPLVPIVKEHDEDIAALRSRVDQLEKELARV